MLRDMGNTDHNHQLTLQDLGRDNWKKSAAKILEVLFDKSNVDLNTKFDELIIVPDGLLWYLPFEALPIGKDEATAQPLISQVRVRYAPTVGLAIPYHHARRPEPKPTGVVLGKLFPHDDDTVAQNAFEPLERSLKPVVLPHNPQAPSALVRTLVDGLIVLDDIKTTDGAYGWSPTQLETNKSGGLLSAWMTLPWGGPEWIVLPGFHTAAENGLRKGTANGNDLFLATCGLMSTGVRTILISRWRPGGQSSFDLVREFSQELPHAVGRRRLAASGATPHPSAARPGGRAAIEEDHGHEPTRPWPSTRSFGPPTCSSTPANSMKGNRLHRRRQSTSNRRKRPLRPPT